MGLSSLIKTAVDTATLPVALVKDIATLNENDETAKKVEDICEDVEDTLRDIFGA
jgi:hypothetical protein